MKKKLYSFKGLGENELSREDAYYVRNMLCVDGINKKRNGWRTIGEFRNDEGQPLKINGIFEFCGESKSCLVVHAGNDFYECGYDLSITAKIPIRGNITVKDEKSYGYMYDGYLWLYGENGLLFYDGKEISSPYGRGFAYAPVTTERICEKVVGAKPKNGESSNLLTPRRRNHLRGAHTTDHIHTFQLDAKVEYGKPFSIEASFRVKWEIGKSDEWTSKYVGIGLENDTVVNVSIYVSELRDIVTYCTPFALDNSGNEVEIEDIEYYFQVVNGRDLTIGFDVVSPYDSYDNIVVEFTEYQPQGQEFFDNVRLATAAATESGNATMLLTAKDNSLYYSLQKDGLLYLPKDNVVEIGKDAQKIKGIVPMVNNYIGIYKESSFYTLKINKESENRLYLSDNTVGCLSPQSVKSIGNDCLALSGEGIFGVNEIDIAELEVARPYNRSFSIQKELDGFDTEAKENAFALAMKGEYWLFVGGRVYICTPRYKIKGSGSKDFSYQWWVFDGCPCTCAIYANGQLYMGREDGWITAFDSEYTDREAITLFSKDADFVFAQEDYLTVTFNSCYGIKAGDTFSLGKHYYYALEGEYKQDGGFVFVPPGRFFDENDCVTLYSGMKIRLYTSDGAIVYDGEILDTYPDECGVYLGEIGLNADTPLRIYFERDEKTEYELIDNGQGFDVYYNDTPVTLLDADIERVYLIKRRAVECELVMSLTDLGTRENKALYGISFTPTEDTRCTVDVGYNTKLGSYERSVVVSSTVDFDDFDYKDPVLAPAFKQSITAPFFERGFEYIRIKIGSRSGGALGLENASVIYSIKK